MKRRTMISFQATRAGRTGLFACLGLSVCLLGTPADAFGAVIELGTPEKVFSMNDFPSISNKSVNSMDVNGDGSRMAFTTHPYYGDALLYVYQLDNQAGDPALVATNGESVEGVAFSRDDNKVFFGFLGVPGQDWDIWQVNSDGSVAVPVITGSGAQAVPCPVVVGAQNRLVYREGWWPGDLWSADMSGGDKIQLTSEGDKNNPKASVDGTKVVYQSQDSANPHDIFLMDSDGTGKQQITTDGGTIQEGFPILAITDQGTDVIVYRRKNPSTDIWEMWGTDLSGTIQEELLSTDQHLFSFDYVPNDPISQYGAIYYFSTPGSGQTAELWRVAVVPEPATLSLLAIGGSALLRRRKK